MDRDGGLRCNGRMSEPLIVQTLKQKRAGILGQIRAYEAQIAHARHDLAHVNATIELLEAPERQRARYIVSHGFFKKGEIAEIYVQHLADDTEMRTGELGEWVMVERSLEITNTVLRDSLVCLDGRRRCHAARRCQ